MKLNKVFLYVVRFIFLIGLGDVYAAAADVGTEGHTARTVHKINDNLFVSALEKHADEPHVYAVMERVTPDTLGNWQEYSKTQRNAKPRIEEGYLSTAYHGYGREGLDAFQVQLMIYRDSPKHKEFEMWVAYILNAVSMPEEPFHPTYDMDNVEMAVTVSTAADAPFTMHMGISRAWHYVQRRKPQHKNLSMRLHGFGGKVMHMLHSEKLYMITAPTYKMREIMLKALPTEVVWVGDSEFYKILESDPVKTRKLFFTGLSEKESGEPYEKGELALAKKFSPITVSIGERFFPLYWNLVDTKGSPIFDIYCDTPLEYRRKADWFSKAIDYGDKPWSCYVSILLSALADSFDHTA